MSAEASAERPALSLEVARRLVLAVVADPAAASLACAVVDGAGHTIALERTAATPFLTAEIAVAKARASALLGRATAETSARSAEVPDLYRTLAELSGGPMLHVAGGIPIRVGERLVGAIGVSGGVPTDDAELAMAALTEVGLL